MPRKLRRLVEQLHGYKPSKIYVFGSYARGEQDSLSDIDLVMIKETDKPFFERMREALSHVREAGPIDVLVYTPGEFEQMKVNDNAFVEMLLDEGMCIYDAEEAA